MSIYNTVLHRALSPVGGVGCDRLTAVLCPDYSRCNWTQLASALWSVSGVARSTVYTVFQATARTGAHSTQGALTHTCDVHTNHHHP